MNITVVIPFRDRGLDPRRTANLDVVHGWWYVHGFDPAIVTDGLDGDAPFNRHRAYNRAVARFPETDVFVFAEADMLIHPMQVKLACHYAVAQHGLVVPFTQYRYLSDSVTANLRDRLTDDSVEKVTTLMGRAVRHPGSVFSLPPESIMDNGSSIGAINVISRQSLELAGGFTEATQGNWYDDRIIEEGFAYMLGVRTRFVSGPAVHLYHVPGHAVDGDDSHLSPADKRATQRNRDLLVRMRADIRMRDRSAVYRLLSYREGTTTGDAR